MLRKTFCVYFTYLIKVFQVKLLRQYRYTNAILSKSVLPNSVLRLGTYKKILPMFSNLFDLLDFFLIVVIFCLDKKFSKR